MPYYACWRCIYIYIIIYLYIYIYVYIIKYVHPDLWSKPAELWTGPLQGEVDGQQEEGKPYLSQPRRVAGDRPMVGSLRNWLPCEFHWISIRRVSLHLQDYKSKSFHLTPLGSSCSLVHLNLLRTCINFRPVCTWAERFHRSSLCLQQCPVATRLLETGRDSEATKQEPTKRILLNIALATHVYLCCKERQHIYSFNAGSSHFCQGYLGLMDVHIQ